MLNRLMPEPVRLGQHFSSVLGMPMNQYRAWKEDPTSTNPHGLRTIMGYPVPTWQRPLVWSERQRIAFLESAWRGLPLGTFTYNQCELDSPYDGLLIDGQQRLYSLQCYLDGEFPVFGYRWDEVTDVDKRRFKSTVFASFMTTTTDEAYLKDYYNVMNFGGVVHTQEQRA